MKRLSIIIILLTSCMTFDYDVNKCDCNGIENEFNTFINESKIRGVKVKNKPVKIKLVSYIDDDVAGRVYYSKNIIEFDTTHWAWTSLKEKVVLHELGHYYLKRKHITGIIFLEGQERPISIMVAGAQIYLDFVSEDLREYYLDELFR